MTPQPLRFSTLLRSITLVCLVYLVVTGAAFAGPGDGFTSDVAQREIMRRQQRVNDAQAAMEKGDQFFAKKDYESALNEYKSALDLIPDAPMTASLRAAALAKWADASVMLAEQRAKSGRYADAKGLLKEVLDKYPEHRAAQTLSKRIGDPDRYNPALTPEHVKKLAVRYKWAPPSMSWGIWIVPTRIFKTRCARINITALRAGASKGSR